VQLAEQVEHRLSRGRVEIAGRLVGEQEAGASGEGARDRHALLLAAGQSARSVRTPIGEADARQDLAGHPKRLRFRNSGDAVRHRDVLLGREFGQQVVELEDESDLLVSESRP
jgi:hypothetical protein